MSYLTEAFKALDALNEDTFSVSDDGIKKLAEFEDNDDLVDEITVYDAEAEDTEDLEDSYVGKVIVDCNVCHSKIYKDKSDVVIDEETQNANIDEECPYCYSTDGFKVIGEVAPMTTETEEKVKVEESLNEATVTDYKGSLSNILVKNQDKISKMSTKGEIVKFLDSITDEVRDKNYLETVKRNMQKKNDFGALQYIYGIILSGEVKGVKESVTEGFKEEDESVNKDLLWAFRKLLREHPQTDIVFTSSYTKDGEIILEPTSYEDFGKLHLFKIDNALKSKGYQISTNKHLYILDQDASIENGNIHIPYEVEDPEEDPDDIDYVYKWDDDKVEVPGTTYSEDDIVQKVYKIVTEDLDIDYDTIDSSKKRNTVTVTIYKADEEGYEAYEVYTLEDGLSDYLDNKAKVKVSLDDDYNIIIKVTLPKGMLAETLKENIGTDIDEYQQWVDYDMKRYGKISDQTNKEIKEAGLQVVKDKYGDYQVIAGKYDESLKESVKNESLEEVEVETGDTKVEISSDEDGKITVSSEPCESEETPEDNAESIKPISDETEAEIEANDGEEDIDIEDFDEESFDELGEGYFKNVYENVNSFKTSNITTKDNKVIVEGVITFNNNVKKNTSFLFESANKTKNGKYRFIGENLNVTKGNKAFSLIGNVTDRKFLSESMNYNYRTKNDIGKFIRCCGTIKRG